MTDTITDEARAALSLYRKTAQDMNEIWIVDGIDEGEPLTHMERVVVAAISAALTRAREAEAEVERLKLEADPEALTIAHMHGAATARDAAQAEMAALREALNFQKRTFAWIEECFGRDMSARADNVRKHRFLEEALELVQCLGTTSEEAGQLVDYVYGRPAGEVRNEIGGTLITLASLCESVSQDMLDCGEEELRRVNVPETIAKIRLKNANKPTFGPLPVDPALAGEG